ncbi:MAG: c-type cytochrome [Sulfurospirillaceae bacterium]|nr:c-type cytochrome [Sulfurospirillaceae bacterium]
MKKLLVLAAVVCATSIFAADGASLFKTCATCHGAKAEKAALNKSQIIAGWSADKITAALNGYKAGTYGGALKMTMVGQVKALDDEKIKALATYISTLK